jgi:thioester reductase-like protein
LSEEEKEKLGQVIDNSMIGITLAELGILEIELMLAGCLSHPDAFMLDSWHRWANEALDHNDLDKALQLAEKITKFLEERQKLCEEYWERKKSRKHNKRYSRHSSRH